MGRRLRRLMCLTFVGLFSVITVFGIGCGVSGDTTGGSSSQQQQTKPNDSSASQTPNNDDDRVTEDTNNSGNSGNDNNTGTNKPVDTTRPIVSSEWQGYQGKDNKEALHNPLMGWSYYDYPERIAAQGIPDEYDVGYILCSWDQIEKQRGVYDFSMLNNAINRLKNDNKTVYLRLYLMPDNVWDIKGYPDWAKTVPNVGTFTQVTTPVNDGEYKFAHPPYESAVYRGLVDTFLKRVRQEYSDGEVDIIDLRAYGLYGEWDSDWGNFWATQGSGYESRKQAVLQNFVKLYKDAFGDYKITKISINVPSKTFDTLQQKQNYFKVAAYDKAMEAGFAIRYDAFENECSDKLFVKYLLDNYYPNAPVFGETTYGWSPEKNNVPLILSNMGTLHANIATFGSCQKNHDIVMEYDKNFFTDTLKPSSGRTPIGYRIIPTAIKYNKEANRDGKIHFVSQWENVGGGVLYRHYSLGLSLADESGTEVYFGVRKEFDITKLLKGQRAYQFSADFNLPTNLSAGTYSVRIALVDERNNYRSAIAMPIAGDDGARNYEVGKIILK